MALNQSNHDINIITRPKPYTNSILNYLSAALNDWFVQRAHSGDVGVYEYATLAGCRQVRLMVLHPAVSFRMRLAMYRARQHTVRGIVLRLGRWRVLPYLTMPRKGTSGLAQSFSSSALSPSQVSEANIVGGRRMYQPERPRGKRNADSIDA
jgi:hypothetical protein